jgi:hypothetical protein
MMIWQGSCTQDQSDDNVDMAVVMVVTMMMTVIIIMMVVTMMKGI